MADDRAGRLRIAQIAPIAGAVSLGRGSSIEYLVALLCEEFVRRGHEVTLFATGDSRTPARLHAVYPRGYEQDGGLWNWEFHEVMHAAAAFEHASDFDVIHGHAYHYALPFARLVETPSLHTYHIVPDDDVLRCYARSPEARLVAVSRWHAGTFTGVSSVSVVPNGIDIASFPFGPVAGDYLLFLGHLIPKKGAADAIRIARKTGMRLVMAGRTWSGRDGGYFQSEVEPYIDGRSVEYAGPVAPPERNELLSNAAALLFPSVEKEPFGLVMIEAMACGTPVAALDRCAVREIIEPGLTGRYASDSETLAGLIPEVAALDRERVRAATSARFDHRVMADRYEALYRLLMCRQGRHPGQHMAGAASTARHADGGRR